MIEFHPFSQQISYSVRIRSDRFERVDLWSRLICLEPRVGQLRRSKSVRQKRPEVMGLKPDFEIFEAMCQGLSKRGGRLCLFVARQCPLAPLAKPGSRLLVRSVAGAAMSQGDSVIESQAGHQAFRGSAARSREWPTGRRPRRSDRGGSRLAGNREIGIRLRRTRSGGSDS